MYKDIDLPDYEKIARDIVTSVTDCFTNEIGRSAKSIVICHLKYLYNKGFRDGKKHMINCIEIDIEKEEGNR